ncbi:MAG: hypothetical protein AAF731_08005 [Bacteroidota bacterium]
MNIYKVASVLAIVSMVASSCIVEDADPIDVGRDAVNIDRPGTTPFFFDPTAETGVSFEVDVTGEGTFSEVRVFKSLEAGGESSDVVLVGTFTSAPFTVAQTETELFADVPVGGEMLDENDLEPGDAFEFSYEIVETDGNVLNIVYTHSVPFSCPLTADFTGMYEIEDITGSGAGGGATIFGTGVVELSEAGDFDRSFEATYLPTFGIGNGPETFTFKLECEEVKFLAGQGSGLACLDINITFGPALEFTAFDPADDSVIDIRFTEDEADACGPATQTEIRLTKVE